MNSEKVVMIIQARMGSSRLPGKSIMKLAGETLVGRILERVKRCKKVDEIVLAIPDNKSNLCLQDIAKNYEVKCFLGSETNLVKRYHQAALFFNADVVVRLPADNPVPEPVEIDRIVEYHCNLNKRGFTSNLASINNSGYPDGIGAEVFDFRLLSEINNNKKTLMQKEHLHLNFFNYESGEAVNVEWCPINTIKCPLEFRRPEIILDVNTIDQYNFMSNLYEDLYVKKPNFNILDIIQWYDNKNKQIVT